MHGAIVYYLSKTDSNLRRPRRYSRRHRSAPVLGRLPPHSKGLACPLSCGLLCKAVEIFGLRTSARLSFSAARRPPLLSTRLQPGVACGAAGTTVLTVSVCLPEPFPTRSTPNGPAVNT